MQLDPSVFVAALPTLSYELCSHWLKLAHNIYVIKVLYHVSPNMGVEAPLAGPLPAKGIRI